MATYPEQYDVRSGIVYGPNDNDFTGNLTLPEQYQVENAVKFGGNGGADHTGNLTLPAIYQVSNGTTFGGNGGADFTGNATFPAEADVANGTQYGGNGTEFTGELNSSVAGPYIQGVGWIGEVVTGDTLRLSFGVRTGFGTLATIDAGLIRVYKDCDIGQTFDTGISAVLNDSPAEVAIDTSNTTVYSTGSYFTVAVHEGSINGTDIGRSLIGVFQIVEAASSSSGGGGGAISMTGELLGTVRVVGPENISLANVSGLAAFDGSLIIASSEGGTSRYAIGATVANATFGTPIADGASVSINAGPGAADTTAISLSVPSGVTLWLLSYRQPRVGNEF